MTPAYGAHGALTFGTIREAVGNFVATVRVIEFAHLFNTIRRSTNRARIRWNNRVAYVALVFCCHGNCILSCDTINLGVMGGVGGRGII